MVGLIKSTTNMDESTAEYSSNGKNFEARFKVKDQTLELNYPGYVKHMIPTSLDDKLALLYVLTASFREEDFPEKGATAENYFLLSSCRNLQASIHDYCLANTGSAVVRNCTKKRPQKR